MNTAHSTAMNDRAAWLKGPGAKCSAPPEKPARAWRLILLGAPGVGKGTQAELLAARLGACHLSTGDVFRAAKSLPESDRSPAMTHAIDVMRRGELVPDQTVLEMLAERADCLRCPGGFLLDGFPRTVPQAQALDRLLADTGVALDAVLNYDLPVEEIVARISGRRTCATCKAVYHVETRPPRKEGACDKCGGQLILRTDDRPEPVRVRMEAYERSTAPLIGFYQERGLLVDVAADGPPEQILTRTVAALGAA